MTVRNSEFRIKNSELRTRLFNSEFRILNSELQDFPHPFRRPRENGSRALLDNRPLNEIGMLDHQVDDLTVREFPFAKPQLLVDRFLGAKQIARLHSHFPQ